MTFNYNILHSFVSDTQGSHKCFIKHQWTKYQNISETATHMCLSFITTVHSFLMFSELKILLGNVCVFHLLNILLLTGRQNLTAFHQQQQDYGLAAAAASLSSSSSYS